MGQEQIQQPIIDDHPQQTPASAKPMPPSVDEETRRRLLAELDLESLLLTEDFVKRFKQLPGE